MYGLDGIVDGEGDELLMMKAFGAGRRMDRRAVLRGVARLAAGSSAVLLAPSGFEAFAEQTTAHPEDSVTWISTTETSPWQVRPLRAPGWRWDTLDVQVAEESNAPAVEGFGACFNELGWTSLQALGGEDRDAVMEELFAPGKGANFSICRMPVGANDFSRKWYSYDEMPGDLTLEHFSIANDFETLVPFIQSAQRYNPKLRLWASPWSPPSWMKRNKFYAEAKPMGAMPANGIREDQLGREGEDMFLQEEPYFEAYARYFGKFIDAYKQKGIAIGMVMPQNEFNSAQPFPSCTWTPEGLAQFVRHLGPEMDRRGVQVFFGTLERGNRQLLDGVMEDPQAGRWIKGVGVQWAGKNAVSAIRKKYPELTLYQSEQECGDGKNDWNYAGYCWNLMKHYLKNGVRGYMYWNISLEPGGMSHWGWPQNSLITVDAKTKKYQFNHEYYVLKHVSHFVQPGARRLEAEGTFDDVLAYRNPDGSVAVILRNESDVERPVNVTVRRVTVPAMMPANSFSTLFLDAPAWVNF
jgi:glucosylceramidase